MLKQIPLSNANQFNFIQLTTKLISLAGIAMLFFSCSDDDSDPAPLQDFSHFTVTSTTTLADGSLSPDNYSYTENLLSGAKRFSVTQGGVTTQRYFYEFYPLISAAPGLRFYYDNQMRLAGVKKIIMEDGVAQELNYRFVYPVANVAYSERLDDFYTNPDAQIVYRNILQFSNGKVVKAGPDQNLDGVMDHENVFTYNGLDLIKVEVWDGTQRNFNYSTVYDNLNMIDDKTYGINVRRMMCAEQYAGTNWSDNLGHSEHVLADEPASDYVVLANNFYQKKTTLTPLIDGAENETTIEFFLIQ